MPTTRAVLFDMGGAIITYRNFEQARRESMTEFARWFGLEGEMAQVQQAFLRAAAEVWPLYTVKPYYLHSDLGKDPRRPRGFSISTSRPSCWSATRRFRPSGRRRTASM